MDLSELHLALLAEGIPRPTLEASAGYEWSNGPHEVYASHRHDYDKVLLCLDGEITFRLPEVDRAVTLTGGRRLDLPANTLHAAIVGAAGVRCYETHFPVGSLRRSA